MKRRMVFLLSVLSLFSLNAYAENEKRLYKIELIVFSQDNSTTEVFAQNESKIKWPKYLANLSDYTRVEPKYMSLYGIYSHLARAYNYKPLMHVAWIQGAKQNRFSKAVKITNTAESINGFFRIQRGNLLHMMTDIEYSSGSEIYHLNEKRRFKLNEIHYLDHPRFGILAKISPIIKPL